MKRWDKEDDRCLQSMGDSKIASEDTPVGFADRLAVALMETDVHWNFVSDRRQNLKRMRVDYLVQEAILLFQTHHVQDDY